VNHCGHGKIGLLCIADGAEQHADQHHNKLIGFHVLSIYGIGFEKTTQSNNKIPLLHTVNDQFQWDYMQTGAWNVAKNHFYERQNDEFGIIYG
jgi:hypothetical protein